MELQLAYKAVGVLKASAEANLEFKTDLLIRSSSR
jgi:hypothetical protein